MKKFERVISSRFESNSMKFSVEKKSFLGMFHPSTFIYDLVKFQIDEIENIQAHVRFIKRRRIIVSSCGSLYRVVIIVRIKALMAAVALFYFKSKSNLVREPFLRTYVVYRPSQTICCNP